MEKNSNLNDGFKTIYWHVVGVVYILVYTL